MLISDVPALAARNAPPGACLHDEQGSTGYAQFDADCQRLARALPEIAARGARVAVLSANRLEFVQCYFGIPGAGMVMLPLNTRLGSRDMGQILDDAAPAVVLVEPALLGVIEGLRAHLAQDVRIVVFGDNPHGHLSYAALMAGAPDGPQPEPADEDDPAWLLYTSGTTGRAKGALLSHRNLMAGVLNGLCGFDFDRHDVALFIFPQFHIAGYALVMYLLRGVEIVLRRGFEVGGFLEAVQRYRVTMAALAPTMLAMVLDDSRLSQYDTSSLRQLLYGAAAMPPEIIRAAMRHWPGVGFGTAFGMTELCGNVTYLNRDDHVAALAGDQGVLASCGRPMPLAQLRIIDDGGRDVPEGQPGEIVVRGDQVLSGYWRNEAATQAAFRDGWFLTGDMARRDAAGRLFVVDRKKDMIITGGENVYSREVEDLLYEHPAVAEAAVVGEPDTTWGENVVALIRVREGQSADPASLDAFCKVRIAGYKRPRRYVFLDELPKSATGKILKADLRRQLRDGALDVKGRP